MQEKNSVEILKDLIRLDSQNPPGNEEGVVGYIHDFCEALEIPNTVYSYGNRRANIVLRLGNRAESDLVLLGHTDVVQANASDWTYDPFAAEVHDGYLYGRGALDMKYYLACCLSVARSLKAIEPSLKRGVTMVFTADEEAGSNWGIKKLLQEEGIVEELSSSVVLNEGGGFAVPYRDSLYYLFETGQKSVCRLEATVAEERDADPYFPTLSHEAVLVSALERLGNLQIDESLPKTVQMLTETFDLADETMDPGLRRLLQTMSCSMVTPTLVHGGARNPLLQRGERAKVTFDCRLLPGITETAFLSKARQAVEDLPVEIRCLQFSEGYEADIDHPILSLMERGLKKADPSIVRMLPFITPGSNDGKYLRPLGCDILGFAPLAKADGFTDIMPLIHGVDERIGIASILFCEQVLADVCINYLTGDTNRG
jgi:acetylornithine deacetylase/succinyl-diaminopimelate desuccinylase-like protein